MAIGDVQNIRLYRYEITQLSIVIDGVGTISIPPYRVKELEIIEDFEKNVFPIFRLVAIVESSTYKKIIRNKNKVNVTLIMDSYYSYIDSTTRHDPGHRVLDTPLQLLMNDNIEDLMYTQKLTTNLKDYTHAIEIDEHDLQMVDNAIEMYLFKSDSLDKTKSSNCNIILKNATVTQAIAYITAKAGFNKRELIMSRPDNTETYDVILIPPLSVLKAFLYLDMYYGLYRTGSLIYFGITRNYIIKYTGEFTAWSADEFGPGEAVGEDDVLKIVIPKTDNSFKASTLGQIDKKSFIGDFHTIDISNDSIANNYIYGNGSQFVDSYTGETYASTGLAFNKNTNYLRLLENRTENEYLTTIYTKQTEGNSIVVTVNLQDVDISLITPNKMYKLEFEDGTISARYEGKFFLSYAKHTFINTGKAITVNTQLVLKRLGTEDS